jgi:hypothetical protein
MGSLGLILTIFFGLLSVVLSLILYVRSRRRKRLTFTYDVTELHTRTHPEITVLFKDRQIDNLSRLRVVIWNSGDLEIRQSDIPTKEAPSIVLTGARILSVAVLEASPHTKCAAHEYDNKTLSVDFEFLNPGDYATLDVLYESAESKPPKIDFVARMIGGLPSESEHFEQPLTRIQWIAPIVFGLAWCLGAVFWAGAIPRWVHRVPNGISIEVNAVWWSLGLIIGLFGFWVVIQEYLRRYRCSRLPRLARHALTRYATNEREVRPSSKETIANPQG